MPENENKDPENKELNIARPEVEDNSHSQATSVQEISVPSETKVNITRLKWFQNKDTRELILIFLTIMLASFTGWMAYETRKLAVQTAKSVALTDSSIYIAKKGLKLSEQNFIIDNRAWVGVESQPSLMEGEGTIVQGAISNGLDFSISIKNYGKTPADSVRVGGAICFSEVRPEVIFKSPIIIPPSKNESIKIFIRNYSDSALNNINLGKMKLYFYGIIIYKDIYNGIDTTEFMYRYNPDPFGFVQKGINRMN